MHGILAVNHTATLTNQIRIDPNVYNGARVISNDVANSNFMSSVNIRKAVLSIKMKNSEDEDRIPQRILIDGGDVLLDPLTRLFSNVYIQNVIPEQWKMSKITPVHKKGLKNDVKNSTG